MRVTYMQRLLLLLLCGTGGQLAAACSVQPSYTHALVQQLIL
jgi:hypothetical protein